MVPSFAHFRRPIFAGEVSFVASMISAPLFSSGCVSRTLYRYFMRYVFRNVFLRCVFTPYFPRRVLHVVCLRRVFHAMCFAPCVSHRVSRFVFRALCFAPCAPLRVFLHVASCSHFLPFCGSHYVCCASPRVLRLHHASAPFYGVGPMCVISLVFRLTFLRVDVDSQVVFSTETPA